MSQKANKIRFESVNTVAPGSDGNDLKNYYLLPTNQTNMYVFVDDTGLPLVTTPMPVVGGSPFSFSLGGWTWNIPNPDDTAHPFVVNGTGAQATASGSWSNNDTSGGLTGGNDGNGESGTFTAQAGQTIDPEEETASAAKA